MEFDYEKLVKVGEKEYLCGTRNFTLMYDQYLYVVPNDIMNLKYLTYLNLSFTSIRTIENLEFPELTELFIHHAKIEIISGLEKLTKLKKLNLEHNDIVKISGLNNCKNLIALCLSNNKIKKIENIPSSLEYLYIDNNQIIVDDYAIKTINKLEKLYEISLRNNIVSDHKILLKLKNIKSLIILPSNRDEQDYEKFKVLEDVEFDVK